MKIVLLIYAVLIAAIGIWWFITERDWFPNREKGPKQKALAVSKHGKEFNESIENVLNAYCQLSESLAKGDLNSVTENTNQLKAKLDRLNLDDLKKDTAGIYETAATIWDNTKSDLQTVQSAQAIADKRQSFNMFSNDLFTLLLTVHYDLAKLYWLECPGDESSGNWIGQTDHASNPYGKANCVGVKKLINFMPADPSK